MGQDIIGIFQSEQIGYSTAMSDDGSIIAVGSPYSNVAGQNAGKVQLYSYDGQNWIQKGQDLLGANSSDLFGWSVSLSGDGNIVSIGAYTAANTKGHVRVFSWDGTSWNQLGQDIEGENQQDQSGYSQELSKNGLSLAIGASRNQGNGSNSGHVRVFDFYGGAWNQRGSDIDGPGTNQYFGRSVSLSANGQVLAVGSPNANSSWGETTIFDWTGSQWVQRGAGISGENIDDASGNIIKISADGNIVAIGEPENDEANTSAGQIRIFKWIGGNWTQLGSDLYGGGGYYRLGESLDLSDDGEILIAGERNSKGATGFGHNTGRVRVLRYDGNDWQQFGKQVFGPTEYGKFGTSVSISSSGLRFVSSASNYYPSSSQSTSLGLVQSFDFFNPNAAVKNSSGCIECALYHPGDTFSIDSGATWFSVVNRYLLEQKIQANEDLSKVCVSKIVNMNGLFSGNTYFNTDITNWDVSNVTQMQGMFSGAASFNQDISNWEVSGVNDMSYMFDGAYSFNQDIGSWNVANVLNMAHMFNGASSFNQDISNWDVSGVNNLAGMFNNAFLFDSNLDSWDVSNVFNMSFMFSHAWSFNKPLLNWDVSNVVGMHKMFDNAYSFNQDLTYWCVPSIVNTPHDFANMSSLNSLNYPNWGSCPCRPGEGFKVDTIAACGMSFTLALEDPYDFYSWSTGDSTSTIEISQSGLYSVNAVRGNCSLYSSVYVNLMKIDGLVASDTISCNGSSLNIFSSDPISTPIQLRFIGSKGNSFTGDISIDDVQIGNVLFDFEDVAPDSVSSSSGTRLNNDWKLYSSVGGFGWTTEDATGVNENSLNTGPHYDNTYFGNVGGQYVYLETSLGAYNDESIAETPIINSSQAIISFSYHMYGSDINKLRLEVDTGAGFYEIVVLQGQQHIDGADPWTSLTIDLRDSAASATPPSSINYIQYQRYRNLQYLWSTGDTTRNITVSPTQTTTYIRTATDGISTCVDSVTIYATSTNSSSQIDSMLPVNANQGAYRVYFSQIVSNTAKVEFREIGDSTWRSKTIHKPVTGSQKLNIIPLFGKDLEFRISEDINGVWEHSCPFEFATPCKPISLTIAEQRSARCLDDSALVKAVHSGGYGAMTYLWSNGASSKRTYAKQGEKLWVTITDASGCSVSDTIVPSSFDSTAVPTGWSIIKSNPTTFTGSFTAPVLPSGSTLIGYRLAYRLRNTQTWSNSPLSTTTSISIDFTGSGLPAGNYEFVAFTRFRDSNNVTVNSLFTCPIAKGYTGTGGKRSGNTVDYSFDTNQINVYPNPADDFLYVQTALGSELRLLDLQGKMITQIISTELETTLDLSALAQGIYMLEIHSQGRKTTERVVKH
jgi:surface protein